MRSICAFWLLLVFVCCVCVCVCFERAVPGLQVCRVHTLFNVQQRGPFTGKISTDILYVNIFTLFSPGTAVTITDVYIHSVYIFLPCVKCCTIFLEWAKTFFYVTVKKFLFLYCMWLPFCTHSFCFQPRKTIKWGLSWNNTADTFSFPIVPACYKCLRLSPAGWDAARQPKSLKKKKPWQIFLFSSEDLVHEKWHS